MECERGKKIVSTPRCDHSAFLGLPSAFLNKNMFQEDLKHSQKNPAMKEGEEEGCHCQIIVGGRT